MPINLVNLKRNSRGRKVGLLHKILLALGFQPKANDVKNQYYGATTEAEVKKFQRVANLPISGKIDTQTNKRLGQLYDALFDDNGQIQHYQINGRLMDRQGNPIASARVELWASLKGSSVRYLEKYRTSNPKGQFRFKGTSKDFIDLKLGAIKFLFFRIKMDGVLVEDTRDSVIWKMENGAEELVVQVALPTEKVWQLKGTISRTGGGNLKDLTIIAWEKKSQQQLAKTETTSSGKYALRFTSADFQESYLPTVYFDILENNRLLLSTRAQALENIQPGSYTNNYTIKGFEGVEYQVSGRIFTSKRVGAPNLKIQLFDLDITGKTLLGETTTDPKGAYQITYLVAKPTEKNPPDIQIQVLSPNDPTEVLAESPIRFGAQPKEIIDLILKIDQITTDTESQKLSAALQTHLNGIALKDLKETKEQKDITYLARKTKWDARLIAMAALAEQFSEQSKNLGNGTDNLPPELYYALFRAGVSTNPTRLYQTNAGQVAAILEQAVEKNIISDAHKAKIPQYQEKFKALGASLLLQEGEKMGVSTLDEMLELSLKNKAQKESFLQLYYHQEEGEDFWGKVKAQFPEQGEQLQLVGQLGFLTINNVPLIEQLHTDGAITDDPIQLVQNGYYATAKWETLLAKENLTIPDGIPGKSPKERRYNYAQLMATQLKLSYPSAIVGQRVLDEVLPLQDTTTKDMLGNFFTTHHTQFDIGRQPVEQFIQDNNIRLHVNEDLHQKATNELKRLQRTYQISPSDEAMKVLLDHQLDSAWAVVQYGEKEFVELYKDRMGDERQARLTYAKAHQVHSTVLNVATAYLTHRSNPPIYALSKRSTNGSVSPVEHSREMTSRAVSGKNVIAYPTLEELFGEMDFCECQHCRSVLSPAAYLVELLQFTNPTGETIPAGKRLPLNVLRDKRPDIEHIELTCENTNTILPYIDLVNEILEHHVVKENIDNFKGYNMDGETTTEEHLANPQFVEKEAYSTLKEQVFPFLLPFDQPLDALRSYYNKLGIPLYEALEKMRVNDELENEDTYGWMDIHLEYLQISRDTVTSTEMEPNGDGDLEEVEKIEERGEYGLLTKMEKALPAYFGRPEEMPFQTFNSQLAYTKAFTRTTGITYKELVRILKTQFINPNSHLIPKLEKLYTNFAKIRNLKEGSLLAEDFLSALPEELDTAQYGGNVVDWLVDSDNYDQIMSLIVLENRLIPELNLIGISLKNLSNFYEGSLSEAALRALLPSGFDEGKFGGDLIKWLQEHRTDILKLKRLEIGDNCSFTQLGLSYSLPDFDQNQLKPHEYIKLLRFVRLWKKLGWTIEQTDKAIAALYQSEFIPEPSDSEAEATNKLNNGFKDLLIRLSHLKRVMEKLKLKPKRDLDKVLVLWSDMGTHGRHSLYRQLFLSATILSLDDVFAEDGYGKFLTDTSQKVIAHQDSIQAAFNLHKADFDEIIQELGFDNTTILSLSTISQIYRFAFLSKAMRLSVSEFIILKTLSGIDPFDELAAIQPAVLNFIESAELLKNAGFKIPNVNYFLCHEDLSGKASPTEKDILAFAKTMRDGLTAIEQEHQLQDDPDGTIARAKMAQMYGEETANRFFNLVEGQLEFSLNYTHEEAVLSTAIQVASTKISYDNAEQLLTFQGVMTKQERNALILAGVDNADFTEAVQQLFLQAKISFETSTQKFSVLYEHHQDELEAEITTTNSKITYDRIAGINYLTCWGYMTEKEKTALEAIAPDASFTTAVDQLYDNIQLNFGAFYEDFFQKHPNLYVLYESYVASEKSDLERQADILEDFLPVIKARSKRLFIRQSLGAALDIALTDLVQLIEDEQNLHASTQIDEHLIYDIFQLETSTETPTENVIVITGEPADYHWQFYLEVPQSKAFDFYVPTDGTNVILRINGEQIPTMNNDGVWESQAATTLDPGQLYLVDLTIEAANNIAIQWHAQGIAKEGIPNQFLYKYGDIQNFRQSYLRLLKVVAILEDLAFQGEEIRYFCQNANHQIDGNSWMNNIQISFDPLVEVKSLFDQLLAFLRYASMKEELKVKDDSLIAVLEDTEATDEAGNKLIEKLTSWDTASIETLKLKFDLTKLSDFLWAKEAMEVIQTLGVPAKNLYGLAAEDLLPLTTNQPNADTVRQLQNVLRSNYDQAGWLKVLQPINDALRNRQRDTLVAFVLFQLSKDPATAHINTSDKLFEYFLIDVEMDACMKTSRIKQAISSVQLFINRCLMNLEPQVSPTNIKSQRWEWIKRYRVWEANRKVFLYPENWLAPELRNTKSPFFKNLESELLQSDITEDTAHVALLHYLEKLDEVAKLEICGMYLQEHDNTNLTDDVLHVIGRTPGANRKYYYRQQDSDGFWTPWEKIDLDIEENPVLPVVWNNRLFLFWMNIIQEGVENTGVEVNSSESTEGEEASTVEFIQASMKEPEVSVKVNLSWSEYYNGKWQPRNTSDMEQPVSLGPFKIKEFNRKELYLANQVGESGALLINIGPYAALIFYNKHSVPEQEEAFIQHHDGIRRTILKERGSLVIEFIRYQGPAIPSGKPSYHSVLSSKSFNNIIPRHDVKREIVDVPFFLQNSQHVFYVIPRGEIQRIHDASSFGIYATPSIGEEKEILKAWSHPFYNIQKDKESIDPIFDGPFQEDVTQESKASSLEKRFLDSPVDIGILKTTIVQYGDANIGALGSISQVKKN